MKSEQQKGLTALGGILAIAAGFFVAKRRRLRER
ncbi:LPXTG cell wall anchor domain-containing protein [Solirubrobacter taibaiensis]|nr:LPXTG cell wall anchor domain-containing protein [Solirubrobacter taibaiensis]